MGRVLTAVLTHLDGALADKQLAYLRSLAPESRFVACHGGARADFDRMTTKDAIFVDDPSLRGPHFEKSINDTLAAIHDRWVRDDASVDFVYLIEYDHLILAEGFEARLTALAERTGAGLAGKWASVRNGSNWPHHLRLRDDERLNRFIAEISQRDDPGQRFGCLGTGILIRRDALEAFCSLSDAPPYYIELFLPTVIHHLGFEVVDVDAVADLYMSIRWLPEFDVEEAIAEKRAGGTFVHPFKRPEALDSILAA